MIGALLASLLFDTSINAQSEDDSTRVRKAVGRSTLDQPGTKPFHLKAELAPTRDRDRDSGRTGEIEIWRQSPTRFRREVRSQEFQQIEIVDGEHRWQKNEGDYFPDWFSQMAVARVRPVPSFDEVSRWLMKPMSKKLWDRPTTSGQS